MATVPVPEIMSAALKDYGKGILVGTKPLEGLVQQIDLRFTNGGGLKYTIARYFTPSGKHIHDVGVEPDIEVVWMKNSKVHPLMISPTIRTTSSR